MSHVGFTSYGLIEVRNEVRSYWQSAEPKSVERHKAVRLYASSFFTAYLMQNQESKAFLSQEPSSNFPELNMTLEHRSNAPTDISYYELVHAVITGEAERAVDELRSLREKQPDHILLSEQSLVRLVLSLDGTWGLTVPAKSVIGFMVELYPTSISALWMLGESYIDTGDYSSAIEAYTRLLELDPDDSGGFIKLRLEWLNSR